MTPTENIGAGSFVLRPAYIVSRKRRRAGDGIVNFLDFAELAGNWMTDKE